MTQSLVLLGGEHAGHNLTYKGLRATWEGDYEVETRRAECECGTNIEVHLRRYVGPPDAK